MLFVTEIRHPVKWCAAVLPILVLLLWGECMLPNSLPLVKLPGGIGPCMPSVLVPDAAQSWHMAHRDAATAILAQGTLGPCYPTWHVHITWAEEPSILVLSEVYTPCQCMMGLCSLAKGIVACALAWGTGSPPL